MKITFFLLLISFTYVQEKRENETAKELMNVAFYATNRNKYSLFRSVFHYIAKV